MLMLNKTKKKWEKILFDIRLKILFEEVFSGMTD